MNFHRMKVRGLQSTGTGIAQMKTTSVRQDNALEMLQSEAEKVRKWQVKVDMNIKEKDKEVKILKETVEALQKAILECKIGKENAERRLDDELKTRETTNKRLESTRQMCMLIKDEFRRIEDTLAVCNQMSEVLHDEDNKKMMKIQKLLDDFVSMEEFVAEASENWKRKYEKLRSEKDELGVLLGNSNRDVVAKSALVLELEEKLSSMQVRVAELELAKSELNDSIQALLATIGGLKRSKDDTIAELDNQIKLAGEIIEEKNQLLSSITEQYEYSKQTWCSSEEDFNAALRDARTEKEILVGRLDEANVEKRRLKDALNTAATEICNFKENLASLQEMLSLATNKEIELTATIQNLHTDLDDAMSKQETLRNDFKVSLSEKSEECQKLEKKVIDLEHEINSTQKNVDQYLIQINEKTAILEERDGQIETLKNENSRIIQEIEEIRSESAEKSKLLKSDCTKAKQSCAAEAKKLKKVTDSCKRLEKKVQELEKSLQKAEATSRDLDENFKEELKKKDDELKQRKKDLADANAQVKELVEAKMAQENETDSKKREHDKEASVMKNKVDELNNVNAKQKDELEFLRKHLKDTEKMLCEEGDKILKKNDKLDNLKKTMSELEYSLTKKSNQIQEFEKVLAEKQKHIKSLEATVKTNKKTDLKIEELNKALVEKEKQIKSLEADAKTNKKIDFKTLPKGALQTKIVKNLSHNATLKECSFSPGAIGQWRRNIEAKRIKIEGESTELMKDKPAIPAGNDIYGTAADELLSEVSFGSMPLDTDVVTRKYLLASSTPKVESKNQAKLHKSIKGQKRPTRKAQPRKVRQLIDKHRWQGFTESKHPRRKL